MIWLIGNKGMLGSDVESLLKSNFVILSEAPCLPAGRKNPPNTLPYICSDIEVDICDLEKLRTFVKPHNISWIINCSAYTAVDKAEDEMVKANAINGEGPKNIAQIATEKNAKLIHISTDYVFDGTKDGAYSETDATNPIGAYGKSKLTGEENVIKTLDRSFIIRTSWLYGKSGNNFVKTILRLFAERDEVMVVADQYGSPTFTMDLADLIVHIIKSDPNKYGIYNFSNEGRTNWFEFAKKIYALAKEKGLVTRNVNIIPITTAEYPTKAKRPMNSYLSKEKVKRAFNYNIRTWQEALSEHINPSTLPALSEVEG